MKQSLLVVLCLMLVAPLYADTGQRLIPAGSLVSCTTGDARISAKTTAVGDPVLCKVEHKHGDFALPYGSYLGGEFAEYKNPGHFVGKGWMQLDFDRLYVGDTAIPISAKVVDVPSYKIDSQGRILGKGHEARDIALWSIPILWPVDLLMLPMRGPRPALKAETSMTLRIMDDVEVPVVQEPQSDPYGLKQRQPNAHSQAPALPTETPNASPETAYSDSGETDAPQSAYPAQAYAAPVYAPQVVPYGYYAAAPVYYAAAPGVVAYEAAIGQRRAAYGCGYGARAYAGGAYSGGAYGSRRYAQAQQVARAGGYGYVGRGGAVRAGAIVRSGMGARIGGATGGFRGR
jgi:hypothetical protein